LNAICTGRRALPVHSRVEKGDQCLGGYNPEEDRIRTRMREKYSA